MGCSGTHYPKVTDRVAQEIRATVESNIYLLRRNGES